MSAMAYGLTPEHFSKRRHASSLSAQRKNRNALVAFNSHRFVVLRTGMSALGRRLPVQSLVGSA